MIYHEERLMDVDTKLINLVKEFSMYEDVIVLCGYRGEKEQTEAFNKGNSKAKWPKSKHNKKPSLAIDIGPTLDSGKSVPWNQLDKWVTFCEAFEAFAHRKGVKLIGGYGFRQRDYPHWELP